jgi:hypothetical protein
MMESRDLQDSRKRPCMFSPASKNQLSTLLLCSSKYMFMYLFSTIFIIIPEHSL